MFKKTFVKKTSFTSIAFLVATLWLGLTSTASAQSLGDLMCNVVANTTPFGRIFQYMAYVAGAIFTVQGIYNLRQHAENPRNHPLNQALLLLGGAALLLTLPAVISTIIVSIYGVAPAGGTITCGVTGATNASGADLGMMMINFVTNIYTPMSSLVSAIAIVSGLFMIVRGLMKASKYGFDPKSNSMQTCLVNILFGAILMSIGTTMTDTLNSIFGNTNGLVSTIGAGNSTVTKWKSVQSLTGGTTDFPAAIAASLNFVQLIGLIAFVRGWMIVKKVSDGGSGNVTLAQGITHIVGGVLAINIFTFLQIMDNTFGTGLL